MTSLRSLAPRQTTLWDMPDRKAENRRGRVHLLAPDHCSLSTALRRTTELNHVQEMNGSNPPFPSAGKGRSKLFTVHCSLFTLLFLTAGCAALPSPTVTPAGPTPIIVPSPTPLPGASLVIIADPPGLTGAETSLQLVLLDLVTGLPYNSTVHPMQPRSDGRWEITLTPPSGSLLAYRFARQNPSPADEFTLDGARVRYRMAHVVGPTQIEETIASWSEAAPDVRPGRIEGRLVDASTQTPLAEFLVGAGGLLTFTDGEGRFQLNGLPPGNHNLTALAPDGSYRPVQQGAIVASDSATPAQLEMTPAPRVQVTFEVTVPGDTVPGIPVRLAGNVRSLGTTFGDRPGGLTTSASRMPALVMVDPTHYLMIIDLYAGTDLRYKYTLGDGLWNAERDPGGAFRTRQVIVPESGLLIQDTVATWHSGPAGSVSFRIAVPENTPGSDTLTMQLRPSVWLDPLPMWRQENSDWVFVLFSPLEPGDPPEYRICRNYLCGIADDVATAGGDPQGRSFTVSETPQETRAEVSAWRWWETDPPPISIVAPELEPSPGYQAGIQWLPEFRPQWLPLVPRAIADMADMNANSLTLSPAWVVEADRESPRWVFDPARSPFFSDLAEIARQAQHEGIAVAVHPSLVARTGSLDEWWSGSPRSAFWWDRWFEAYRSLALTYAAHATGIGATRLVLGGTETSPSLPGGRLADGSASGAPLSSELRWRELIAEVRSHFSGTLVFEVEFGAETAPVPAFVDLVDEVRVIWRLPLGTTEDQSFALLEASAGSGLDQILLGTPVLAGKPVILVIEIASAEGGSLGCVPRSGGSCQPASAFDLGAEVDPEVAIDMVEQAEAVNALLLQSSYRAEVQGFVVARYNPAVWLRDKSASVGGKPARDVLWYWYPRLVGP